MLHLSIWLFGTLTAQSTAASAPTTKARTTNASAPVFRSMERAEKRKQVVVYQSLHVQFVNTMIQVAVRSKYNSEPLVLLSFLDITAIL